MKYLLKTITIVFMVFALNMTVLANDGPDVMTVTGQKYVQPETASIYDYPEGSVTSYKNANDIVDVVIVRDDGWIKIKIDEEFYYMKGDELTDEPTITEDVVTESRNLRSIGVFKCTFYSGGGKTYTGTTCTVNRTLSVDPRIIPLGSHVVINGIEYIAEDIGGSIKGHIVDIYLATRKECFRRGIEHSEVFIVE